MDEWELLNTEDGLALQEFLLQELYELHKQENLQLRQLQQAHLQRLKLNGRNN